MNNPKNTKGSIKYRVRVEDGDGLVKDGFTDLKDVMEFVTEIKKTSENYYIETYLDISEVELLLESDASKDQETS